MKPASNPSPAALAREYADRAERLLRPLLNPHRAGGDPPDPTRLAEAQVCATLAVYYQHEAESLSAYMGGAE